VEWIEPLPGGYGYVIQEGNRTATGLRQVRYVWQQTGGATVLFESMAEDEGKRLFGSYDGSSPLWRYAVLRIDRYSERTVAEQAWWLLDLDLCDDEGCARKPLQGRPLWSPDGSQTLLEVQPVAGRMELPTYILLRAGQLGQNAVQVDRGYSPFWLDGSHYGYLRSTVERAEQELVVAAAADDRARVVARSEDFAGLLDDAPSGDAPAGDRLRDEQWLQMDRVASSPTDPQLLLVQASRWPRFGNAAYEGAYLFAVRLSADLQSTAQIELLFDAPRSLEYELSPNGRWLAVTDYDEWTLLDLQSGER
jgi:hypothetical protein